MSAVERLALLITADGQGAIREFTKVGQAAERDLGKAENRADRLGSKMTSAGAVMMGASAVMVAGLWNAGQSAAALEQSIGGAESVFKDSAGVIRTWAEGAAQSAGLSEEAALRLTTRLGGALKGLGFEQQEAATKSIELTQVAADLAATYGGTTADAVQALGAAFRGEFDPAEQFNLFLKQSTVNAKAVEMGLANSTTEVDANARAQATLALITEQSADAQGQFGRETDTTAGRLAIAQAEFENLKAQVGAGFTPVMSAAGNVLGTVTNALRSADDATNGLASQFLGFGSVGLGAAGALSFIVGQAIKMRDTFSGLGAKIKSGMEGLAGHLGASADGAGKFASSLGRVGSTLPIVGAAAVAGIAVWQTWQASQERARQRAEDFTATLDEQTGAVTANTEAALTQKFLDDNRMDNLERAGVSVRDYTAAIEDNTDAMMSQDDVMAQFNNGMKGAEEDNRALAASLREQGGARNELLATIIETGAADKGLIEQIYEETASYDKNQAAIREANIQKGMNAGLSREQAEAEADAAAAADAHTQAMKDQNDAQKALLDPMFGAIDALEGNRDAQRQAAEAQQAAFFAQLDYNQAVAEHGPASKEALEAQEALNEAIERADDSNLAAAKSALDVDQAVRTLSGAVVDGTVSWQEADATLEGWVAQGLITREQAEQVRGKLAEVKTAADNIPKSTFTTAYANIDNAVQKFNDLLSLLRTVPQGMTITMNGQSKMVTSVGVTAGVPSSMARVPGSAGGGGLHEGWNIVGEHGPEPVWKQGSVVDVYPNTKPVSGMAPMGGAAPPVVIQLYTAPGTPASQIDDMLSLLRQNQGEVQRALGLS